LAKEFSSVIRCAVCQAGGVPRSGAATPPAGGRSSSTRAARRVTARSRRAVS
jgi:hypothetical protein